MPVWKPYSKLQEMIRNVYINGQISTFLVFEGGEESDTHPIIETLKNQAERIESLEARNGELIRQKEILLHLMEVTVQTGELMTQSLKAIKDLEERINGTEEQDSPAPQPI